MKKAFFILSILWTGFYCYAEQSIDARNWKQGNDAYRQKKYDSAIFYYQKILQVHSQNALVQYNLGNAFYKNNEVGKAVLSYERALFLQPSLKKAEENLQLAKSRIPNSIKQIPDIFFIKWWHNLTSSSTTNTWAVLALVIFLTLIGSIFYSLLFKKRNNIPTQIYFILPLLSLLFLFFSYTSGQRKTNCALAVVMNKGAVLVTKPNVYKGQIQVPEATTVITDEKKGNWIAVTLPDNKTGWMQITELNFVYQPEKNR